MRRRAFTVGGSGLAPFALVAAVLVAAVWAGALAPGLALAQPSLGLGRRLDRPSRHAPRAAQPAAPPEEPGAEDPPWAGPQIALHYSFLHLADGYGGGDTHVGGAQIFIQWPVSQLRTALLAEVGSRDYALGGDDLFVRGSAEIGFQLTEVLDPFIPHVSFVVSFGAVAAERFETTVAYGFGGAGLEIGAALRIFRNLHLAASLGYQRLEMDGAGFDLLLVRLGVGL